MKKTVIVRETVEEFLARGGKITVCTPKGFPAADQSTVTASPAGGKNRRRTTSCKKRAWKAM